MRYSMWDPMAVQACKAAKLTQAQQALVEGLMRSLEAGTYLTEHVAGHNSAVLALTRSHNALFNHSTTGQPNPKLTQHVLECALIDVQSAAPAYRTTRAGGVAIRLAEKALQGGLDAVIAKADKSTKKIHADAIEAVLEPTAHVVRELLEQVWDGPALPADIADLIRNELAVLVVLEGRDGLTLRVDLLDAIQHRKLDVPALTRVLWPPKARFRVAVTVHGTRHLQDLDQLLPGAKQWQLTGGAMPLGTANDPQLRSLVAAARSVPGPSALVEIPVESGDARSAIKAARRRLSETLDQYAAGHRLLSLTIGPLGAAIDGTNRAIGDDERTAGSKSAQPLTRHWSMPLRSALRMAHLANQVEAPMASSALAWSALETLGAKENMLKVAKAAALHSVRQQIISLYKTVAYSALARLTHAGWRIEQAEADLVRGERALSRARGAVASQAAQTAVVRLQEMVSERRAQLAEAREHDFTLKQVLLPAMETVRRNLLDGGGGSDHPLQLSSWLLNVNRFFDAVVPPEGSISTEEGDNCDALEVLAGHAGGLALEQWTVWNQRLSSPSALAGWLDHQQGVFHGLLKWMYATRNTAFHEGKFSAPADTLTAHAARSLVDMVLEFLGHWHRVEHETGQTDTDTATVIEALAERKDDLVNALRSATSCRLLNVADITSPNSDCWNRT
ncbi:hypothetical protein ACFC0K_36400 [Streptomyces hydrogenans]|uniref:hypothetical protein n=1 Tax=Streptomyces hydrogenans TaxID=1873719 RepID=UPI0035D94EFA